MSLRDEVLSGGVAKAAQTAIGAGGSVWLAWKLGPVGLGEYAIVISLAFILSRPVDGMAFAGKHRASSGMDMAQVLGLTMAIILVWTTVLFSLISILEGLFIAAGIVSYSIYIPFQTLGTVRDVGIQTWNATGRVLVTVAGQVFSFIVLDPSVSLAIAWYIIGNGVGILLSLRLIGTLPRVPYIAQVRSIGSYAKHSIVSSLTGEITDRADILILGAIVGTAAAGDYEVAWRLTVPVAFVAILAGSGHMRDVAGERTKDRMLPLHFVSVFSVPFVGGAALLGIPVLELVFGTEYRSAWLLLVGLALFQLFRTQSIVRRAIINGDNRPDIVKWVNIVTLFVNVTAGMAGAYFFGPLAVVVATVVTELGQLAVYTYFTGRPAVPRGLLEQIVSALVMVALLGPLISLYPPQILLELAAFVLFGVVAYFTSLLVLGSYHRRLASDLLPDRGLTYLRA